MIETARLLLRPLAEADLPVIASALNNYNVSRHTGRIPHPYSEADAADYFAWLKTLAPGSLSLCIDEKAGAKAIGGIGYQLVGTEATPELGYWLAENHWGRGYGFEAAEAMARHAFAAGGHAKLKASYHLGNEASRRILGRLGFRALGTGLTFSQAQGREVETVMMELERR